MATYGYVVPNCPECFAPMFVAQDRRHCWCHIGSCKAYRRVFLIPIIPLDEADTEIAKKLIAEQEEWERQWKRNRSGQSLADIYPEVE